MTERKINRSKRPPGNWSDEEYAQVEADALANGMNAANWVRYCVGLSAVRVGAPEGNQNAVKVSKRKSKAAK